MLANHGPKVNRRLIPLPTPVILDLMSEFTRILSAVDQGDTQAVSQLLPLVYDELRRLAADKLRHEKPGQTLQPTALVHEAYLRLMGSAGEHLTNRRHFFSAAANAMRVILIESARRKMAEKRGRGRERQDLDPDQFAAPAPAEELLALYEALTKLASSEPEVAELVRLRYFAGLTIPEAATVLGIAPRTANDWWSFARAWLLGELREPN
jgi:RNA polymerase sigma factor (TIGR02999 family)